MTLTPTLAEPAPAALLKSSPADETRENEPVRAEIIGPAVASKCLCILGMHRSGTSALARTINLLGMNLGSNLVPANVDNPKGFWEHKAIVETHERLFEALDTWYDDTFILPENWADLESVAKCRAKLRTIIREDLSKQPFWCFKDPRTCRLLPLWREVFRDESVRVQYVLMVRNPWEIAYSLAVRNGFSINKSLLLMLLHLLEAEAGTRGCERAVITYDELMLDWRKTTSRLAVDFDIEWPEITKETVTEIDAFVDPNLRHHKITGTTPEKAHLTELPGDARLVRWSAEVYEILARGATLDVRPDGKLVDEARLDAIRAELLSHIQEFNHWRGELSLGRRIRKLELFVEELKETEGRLEMENNRLRTELDERPATDRTGGLTEFFSSVLRGQRTRKLERQIKRLDEWNGKLADGNRELAAQTATLRERLEQQDRINARLIAGRWSTASTKTRGGRPGPSGRSRGTVAGVAMLAGVAMIEPLQASVDLAILEHPRRGPLRVSGWCTHPRTRIRTLRVSVNSNGVECTYGLVREDVGSHFPHLSHAKYSGFIALLPYRAGSGYVRLDAVLEDGQAVTFVSTYHVDLPPVGPMRMIAGKSVEMVRALDGGMMTGVESTGRAAARVWGATTFVRFMVGRARGRINRTGGLPGPRETARLMRMALHEYMVMRRRRPAGEGGSNLPPPSGYDLPRPADPYVVWQELNAWSPAAREQLLRRLEVARERRLMLPRISIVMPVFNPPAKFLDLAIQSVVKQVYTDWEFCIADDQSTDAEVLALLEEWAAKEPRIKLVRRETNGNISRATNSAAELASSEFLFFLDHDDEIPPDSLAEAALYLAHYPDTDFLYSDDDKIDINGIRFAPQFKPDFSPELLLSYMYLGHIGVVRTSIYRELGGLRVGFEGSQDYDFALRATEKSRRVGHIPLVLYHWRAVPGSTALSGGAKPKAFEAGRKSIQEALDRRGHRAKVHQPKWASMAAAGIYEHAFPDDGPSVAVVIPTRNNTRTLRTCIESLARTAYRNFRIVVIDNESDKPEAVDYLHEIEATGTLVLRIGNPPSRGGKWSFAYLNNEAVKRTDVDYIVFLNDDVEVRDGQWLSQMVGYGQFAGVGAVGARLLYPDGRIQHAGVVHGLHHGLAGHAFKLLPTGDNGYQAYAKVARNYSAVTAACMLTRRDLFLKLGGFDEENFAVAYNDVDYCYRLADAGFRCVYAPGAELTHHEGFSRGFKDNPAEAAAFRQKYNLRRDPYFSPYLSLDDEQFNVQPRHLVRDTLYPTDDVEEPVPLRIMMFSNALNLTGGPLHQYEIAVHLKRTGQAEPIIWCHQSGPLQDMYADAGIEVIVEEHPLTHAAGSVDVYDRAAGELGEWMDWRGIDVVYANTLESFLAVEAAHQVGIPSVWNVHESEPWQTYFIRFGDAIAGRALRCFEFPYRMVFVSDATRDGFLALNSRRNFCVVHNGLDTRRLDQLIAGRSRQQAREKLHIQDGEVALLLLGTVCERKGQFDLTIALSMLPHDVHDKIRVFIVGDRPSSYSDRLHAAVGALPPALQKRVDLVEETKDTATYYLAADVFVCTSRVESFPRVIMEAMYFGLPVVTTPVFGIREQVTPGINGLYYDPGQPQQLMSALLEVINDPDLRRTFGENARQVLRKLNSFADMNRAYAMIFQEAMGTGVTGTIADA